MTRTFVITRSWAAAVVMPHTENSRARKTLCFITRPFLLFLLCTFPLTFPLLTFHFSTFDELPAEFADRGTSEQAHGAVDVGAQDFDRAGDAGASGGPESPRVGPADEHGSG